jgi:hypothetical protein
MAPGTPATRVARMAVVRDAIWTDDLVDPSSLRDALIDPRALVLVVALDCAGVVDGMSCTVNVDFVSCTAVVDFVSSTMTLDAVDASVTLDVAGCIVSVGNEVVGFRSPLL